MSVVLTQEGKELCVSKLYVRALFEKMKEQKTLNYFTLTPSVGAYSGMDRETLQKQTFQRRRNLFPRVGKGSTM